MLARANIEMHGLSDRINVIEGDALKVISKLNTKYDVIFIDGPKSHYIEYLPICLELLNEDGIIIADNVNYKGWVNGEREVSHKHRTSVTKLRAFIDEVKSNNNLINELVNIGDGLLIIKKK
jgi:predicted O-methyltransferase YrrM